MFAEEPRSYWSQAPDVVLAQLRTSATGLTSEEAGQRLAHYGPNVLQVREQATVAWAHGTLVAEPRRAPEARLDGHNHRHLAVCDR